MDAGQRDAIVNPANGLMIYPKWQSARILLQLRSPAVPVWTALLSGPPGVSADYKIPINQLPVYHYTIWLLHLLPKNCRYSGNTIQANNVSIDLNFFSINGNPGNTASGITVSGTRTGNHINATSRVGVKTAFQLLLPIPFVGLNLQLLNNGGDGLVCGDACTLEQCHALKQRARWSGYPIRAVLEELLQLPLISTLAWRCENRCEITQSVCSSMATGSDHRRRKCGCPCYYLQNIHYGGAGKP